MGAAIIQAPINSVENRIDTTVKLAEKDNIEKPPAAMSAGGFLSVADALPITRRMWGLVSLTGPFCVQESIGVQ